MERLDKIIASQGIGSRKDAARMIKQGRVTVDGNPCHDPDTKLDPACQTVCVDGQSLIYKEFLYIMMNKPAGVLSASHDPRQTTVIDLLPEPLKRRDLFPAGRLDKDTEGLLVITDDGQFAHRMLSPKKEIFKVYEARLDGEVSADDVEAFAKGLILADGTRCRPATLQPMPEHGENVVRVVICEGKFHQVKRMVARIGKRVLQLKRVQIGALALDPSLGKGGCRELREEELGQIFS